MRWTQVCPLVGATLLACASEENQYPDPSGLMAEGGSSGSATAGGGNAASGSSNAGSSNAGSSSASGGSTSGSSAGGSGGSGGTFTSGGTFMNGGSGSGGTFSTGGGGAGGSSAGTGGTMAGGGGAGGNAGAGGKPAGGAGGGGGTGGTGVSQCTGVVIPPKTSWQGSALRATDNDPPSKAFDGDNTTRFATGSAQMGDEWLQIDFGEVVTLNQVLLHTNNNDYFRHFELRLSNTSQDFNVAALAEADGMAGTMTVDLPKARAGRYLTIRQTGTVTGTTWWSLHEVTVACK